MLRRLAILLLLLNCSIALAGASFSVAPGRVSVDLSKPNTTTFIIRNNGDQRIHLRVIPTFFPLESKALRGGISLAKDNESATSLKPYMIVSPEALSLEPGEQREVRVSVHPPANLAAGTYRAHVEVKMLEVARVAKIKSKQQQVGMALNLMLEMAVAVYGHKGDGQAKLHFTCHEDNTHHLVLNVTNKTPWHFTGTLNVLYRNSIRSRAQLTVYRQSITNKSLNWYPGRRHHLSLRWRADKSQHWQQASCDLG